MPDRDGFITAGESQRLEAQAEALLKQDAKDRGFIRDNGRGFSEYARRIGITTKKTLETTFKHEKLIHQRDVPGIDGSDYLEFIGPRAGDPADWVEACETVEEYAAALSELGMVNIVDPSITTNKHKED